MKNLKETIIGFIIIAAAVLLLAGLALGMGYCAMHAFTPLAEVPRICM